MTLVSCGSWEARVQEKKRTDIRTKQSGKCWYVDTKRCSGTQGRAPKSPWRQKVACPGEVMGSSTKVTSDAMYWHGTAEAETAGARVCGHGIAHACLQSQQGHSFHLPWSVVRRLVLSVTLRLSSTYHPSLWAVDSVSTFQLSLLVEFRKPAALGTWILFLWAPGVSQAAPLHGLTAHFPAWAALPPSRDGRFHAVDFAGAACHPIMAHHERPWPTLQCQSVTSHRAVRFTISSLPLTGAGAVIFQVPHAAGESSPGTLPSLLPGQVLPRTKLQVWGHHVVLAAGLGKYSTSEPLPRVQCKNYIRGISLNARWPWLGALLCTTPEFLRKNSCLCIG